MLRITVLALHPFSGELISAQPGAPPDSGAPTFLRKATRIPTALSIEANPKTEARALVELLRSGESVEGLRKLIGPQRRVTLREFDLLVLRLPKHPERQRKLRLRKKCNGMALSPELRADITALLKAGWSQKNVLRRYPVGPGVVLRISKQIGASYLKPRGRGRRFSPQRWKEILAAVKSGRASRDIERAFHCDYVSVLKARKELGDFENRRLRLKITPAQIARAEEMLRAGECWRDVARSLGLSQTTVIKHVKYRKHRDAAGFVKLSRKKYAAIAAALDAGKSRPVIYRELRTSWRTVDHVYRETQRTKGAHV